MMMRDESELVPTPRQVILRAGDVAEPGRGGEAAEVEKVRKVGTTESRKRWKTGTWNAKGEARTEWDRRGQQWLQLVRTPNESNSTPLLQRLPNFNVCQIIVRLLQNSEHTGERALFAAPRSSPYEDKLFSST